MPDNLPTLLEREKETIFKILPDYVSRDRWWGLMMEVARSRDLQRIAVSNPLSLVDAFKRVADWGLDLDGEEAFIIPYGETAQAQAGYKGLIRRAVEAGVVAHMYAELVREGEHIEIISGSKRALTHTPNPFVTDKKIIGVYAVAYLANGVSDFEIMNATDIAAVKQAALRMAQRRDKNAGESPAWRFFETEMMKKSVIRRFCKRLRGKRDTDAGRRYAEMLASEPSFDTTATVISHSDDLPQAPEVENEIQRQDANEHGVSGIVSGNDGGGDHKSLNDQPAQRPRDRAGAKAESTDDRRARPVTVESTPAAQSITTGDVADLQAMLDASKLKPSVIMAICEEFGIGNRDNLHQLRADQLEAFGNRIAQLAGR